MGKTLVVGSSGQIGTELVEALKEIKGEENVIASDIKPPQVEQSGIFETLNILDKENLLSIIKKHQVTEVYLLAALLSATAEKNPIFAWDLNMNGLFNVLNLAKDGIINKIFWPSSIAVFGPNTPKINTPQFTVTDPTTVYGISKLAGERWCEYYFNKYNVDVRSIRYPGLIGYNSLPGGGTTDYAVDIFYKALKEKSYECFLKEDTTLPMMYMPDAIRATIELMEAESNKITIRSSYNLSSLSFSPLELVNEIKKIIPEFKATYTPDFRQKIAASWPQSIDDSCARKDWGWKEKYNLEKMTMDMIKNLKQKM
ncbi:MAG: NAD-dependent epimerase/dehydratase family protein [Vicingaceae bacterium]